MNSLNYTSRERGKEMVLLVVRKLVHRKKLLTLNLKTEETPFIYLTRHLASELLAAVTLKLEIMN